MREEGRHFALFFFFLGGGGGGGENGVKMFATICAFKFQRGLWPTRARGCEKLKLFRKESLWRILRARECAVDED